MAMTKKDMCEETVSSVLKGITVPAQPQVLVDIHKEQKKHQPDISRMSQLISQDVGLAGSVLKVVNSKSFGLTNKIASIQQGVALLGINTIVNIVDGLSIKSEMDDDTISTMGRYWDAASEMAMVCATVAKAIGCQTPDLAYTLGLFHNCGVPILINAHPTYPQIIEEAYSSDTESITAIENRHLNTNHAVMGFFVAKSWGLPLQICEIIAEHHRVYDIFNSESYANYNSYKKTLMAILKMSEHIAQLHLALGHQEHDHEWEGIEASLFSYVGLTSDQFDDIKESCEELHFEQFFTTDAAANG